MCDMPYLLQQITSACQIFNVAFSQWLMADFIGHTQVFALVQHGQSLFGFKSKYLLDFWIQWQDGLDFIGCEGCNDAFGACNDCGCTRHRVQDTNFTKARAFGQCCIDTFEISAADIHRPSQQKEHGFGLFAFNDNHIARTICSKMHATGKSL